MVVQRSYSSTRPSCLSSSSSLSTLLWNPTEEHAALRNMLRSFVADEVRADMSDLGVGLAILYSRKRANTRRRRHAYITKTRYYPLTCYPRLENIL